MKRLQVFDDGEKIATITQIDGSVFVFARSAREWGEMKRLTAYGNSKDKKFLEKLAKQIHEFNYSTELSKI